MRAVCSSWPHIQQPQLGWNSSAIKSHEDKSSAAMCCHPRLNASNSRSYKQLVYKLQTPVCVYSIRASTTLALNRKLVQPVFSATLQHWCHGQALEEPTFNTSDLPLYYTCNLTGPEESEVELRANSFQQCINKEEAILRLSLHTRCKYLAPQCSERW
jgi:hypothetical protein